MEFEQTLRDVGLALARFAVYGAHGLLFGTVGTLLLVFRPSYEVLEGDGLDKGRKRFGERVEGLIQGALITSVVATVVVILLQATVVADLRGDEVGMASVEGVLDTTFGRWTALRIPVLLTLSVLIVSRVRRWSLAGAGDDRRAPSLVWWGAWFVLALVLLITSTYAGHTPVATPKWLAVINDITHMVAASIWFAGIILLAVALPDGSHGMEREARIRLLAESVKRFSHVAMISIGIVALTGTVNSLLHVGAFNDLFDTGYGRMILVKILLFLGILGLGGINHYFVRQRLEAAAEGRTDTPARKLFRRTIAVELVIAIGLMGATGVLTGLARTKKNAPASASVGGGSEEQASDKTHRSAQR